MMGKLRLWSIMVVLALFVGALAGAFLLPPVLPKSSQPVVGPRVVPVTNQKFDDQHTIAAVPDVTNEVSVGLTGGGGMITASQCKTGLQPVTGDVFLSIEDRPRIAIVTKTPLWRDLKQGVKGEDVEALQEALIGLKFDVTADGTFGPQTTSAVREIQAESSVEQTGKVELNKVQWIPSDLGPISACETAVGSIASNGGSLFKAGGGLIGLRIPENTSEIAGQKYAVVAGEHVIPLSKDREVTDKALLKAVESSRVFSEWKQDPGRGVAVQVRLLEPIDAVGIPPSSVIMKDATHGCVVDSESKPQPVEVLSSELGTVYVLSQAPFSSVKIPAADVIDHCK